MTNAPAHTLYSIQAAQILQDLRLYILLMLKPRHARYRTFRTEEQQQLHTHTSLFHNRGFITGGFTTGGSLYGHKVSPQGRSTQGFTKGRGRVISVSVGQVSSHAYILTNRYWFWLTF